MKRFIVEDDFRQVFPDSLIGIVVCRGLDNSIRNEEEYREMLKEAEREALKHLTESEFSENGPVKVWREAFRKFKTKKGARSSIEALLKRVQKGQELRTINPLVDIYNAISLRYGLPCGGEDIDTFVGDIKLTKAIGDEDFIVLGEDKSSPPYEGEIVYKDDLGAICRCWNWRESVRTMLTDETKNAFLCIELVDDSRRSDLEKALKELSDMVKEKLGGTCEISILDSENGEAAIEP